MLEFLDALRSADIPFMRYAFCVGLLASVAFGVVGTYVVVRRITYVAGAIAHSVLGGIGIALYVQQAHEIAWISPIAGAVIAALLAALVIGLVSTYAKEREDTVIGAIWAVGMAVGLIFLYKTPGYFDPMSYLFGDITLISRKDIWIVAGLDVIVVVLSVVFYSKLLAVSFDEEFARLRGVNVTLYYLLLVCLTALTVVLLVRVVGIVMVVALLTLPAAVAGHFSRRLWQMMLLSVVFCAAFTVGGLGLSYSEDLPAGPTIIVIAGAAYLLVATLGRLLRRRRATD